MSESIHNNLNRRASINYGLERLNFEIENSSQKNRKSLYTSEEMPGMEILDKFTSFDPNDFHFKWATLIFLCNIYNHITVAYYIGISGFPSGVWLVFELASETILLADIGLRVILRNTQSYKKMWFIHENTGFLMGTCFLASSVPYSLICLIYAQSLDHWGVALVKLPKLLRGVQISTYFTNFQIIRRINGWLYVEFTKYLLIVLFITHYVAMVFLFVNRLEYFYNPNHAYSFDKQEISKPDYQILSDSEFWALGSLASVTISEVVPITVLEKLVSVLIIVIGTSIFGVIFGKIVLIKEKKNFKKAESKRKLGMAKNWINIRKISDELSLRITNFYNFAKEKFSNIVEYDFLSELPLSLRTEICLYMHKDLIPKVKLFELGDPTFMMGIVRHLKPKLYMAADFIIRRGDYAEEFFIIRVGAVEVLSTDDVTAISILEEGAYFGEIGILLGVCRTVSVRATIATLISCIHKKDLMNVLNNFPEHLDYLKKVAEQRFSTTNPSEFDVNFDLLEEYSEFDSNSSDESDDEIEYYTPAEHKNKSLIEKFITVEDSKAIPGSLQIDPLSQFFYLWAGLLISTYVFYLFYLPFAIAFKSEGSWVFLALDVFSLVVFCADIMVSLNMSLLTEFGNYVHEVDEVRKNYYNKYFLLDILSVVPADLLAKSFSATVGVIIFSKMMRLLKFKKTYDTYYLIKTKAETALSSYRLIVYIPVIAFLSHLSACLFFLICKLQYEYYQSINSTDLCFISKFFLDTGVNFLDLPISDQYIDFIYFASSIFSSNTYNVIIPYTFTEQIFCFIIVLTSRILLAFLLAEASTLIGSFHKPYTDELAKVSLIKEWVAHYKLPQDLVKRIMNHYTLLWIKLKGVEDEEIIKDLPESMQVDLNYFLFSGLINSGFFPKEEQGAIRSIMKKCKVIMQCHGEEIVSIGELGLEMYFILEGEVKIKNQEGRPLQVLSQGCFFGEMALLTPFPTVRVATAIAKSDVVLAVLSMDDFNFVMQIYPDFASKVRKQAANREKQNREIMHSANLDALKKHKKLSFIVKNSGEVDSTQFLRYEYQYDFTQEIISEVPVKLNRFAVFLIFHQNKAKDFVYLFITIWNLVFLPVELAFTYDYFYVISSEVMTVCCYIVFTIYYYIIWHSMKVAPEEIKKKYLDYSRFVIFVKILHHLLLIIPSIILFSSGLTNSALLFVSVLIRVTSYIYIIEFLAYSKQKLEWFNIIRISEVIFHSILISHIVACIFIYLSKFSSNNWIVNLIDYNSEGIGSGHDLYIYVNALYWAFTCLSHASLGDIRANSNIEQLYNSFVCLLGWFVYVLLFGNISSLVLEFASKLRSRLLDSYNIVIDFIKKKRIDIVFNRQVNDYFNYLYQSNKGNIDSEILKQLPNGIMSDIQLYRFGLAIENSQIFKDFEGITNYQLARSLFRLMEIQFYLIGDTVIKLGERSFDIYIILEGECDVFNLKGNQVVANLRTGDHFGEANLLLNTSIRTTSVIASKISQIGVITKENAEKMFAAFPEWKEILTDIANKRVSSLFHSDNQKDLADRVIELNEKLLEQPHVFKKYTKRAEKLIAPKILLLLKNTQENKWFKMSILHLLFIIYSVFAIPIEIAFDYPVDGYLLYFEALIVVESFCFFLITFKYSLLIKARKEYEYKDIIKFYYQNFIIQDIIAFSPFNLIFPLVQVTQPKGLIIILRMLRLVSVVRIPSLLQKIEIFSRSVATVIGPMKSLFFLVMLMHWSSCFWYFIVSSETQNFTWINLQGLNSEDAASVKWSHSIYYIMNIATGTGYSDTYPVTLLEKFLTIIYILFGNIVFAVAFGLIASLLSTIHHRINNLLDKLRKVFDVLNKSDIPHRIVSRLEAYYAFNDSLVQTFGNLDCKMLYNHLPKNIVNKITYECNKHILKKMPFFEDNEFMEMTERISLYMVPKIYLPNDYIIYKNDIGEEMYFIILGNVEILSPDNNKVVKILGKGDYVGEVALLFDAKRICSVVASSLSLLYLLGKAEFREVIKDYPKALDIMTMESNKRKAEAIIIQESQKRNVLETIEENPELDNGRENLVNTLNLYSAISNPFFGGQGSEKNMTVLTGMNNVKSELVRESYGGGNKGAKLYKRRPNTLRPNERRLSQESLGKEIVLSNFSKIKMQWIVEESN